MLARYRIAQHRVLIRRVLLEVHGADHPAFEDDRERLVLLPRLRHVDRHRPLRVLPRERLRHVVEVESEFRVGPVGELIVDIGQSVWPQQQALGVELDSFNHFSCSSHV
jgi:hypothetical protein